MRQNSEPVERFNSPGISEGPEISVVIPVHNAALYLERCLEAVANSQFTNFEVIVVDDGSTDSTLEIAKRFDVIPLSTNGAWGPASARNLGARHARGKILLFVDADVVVPSSALKIVAEAFQRDSELAALFGSYDDTPPWKNVISQYKNLLHHYIHQISSPDATTFWTGLGAIRKSVFVSVGGFNEKRFRRPSIEDVELGYRLRQAGLKILLDKRLQGKHLKRWELRSLLDSDILCRAIPWSFLILETKKMPKDLNFRWSHRASTLLVGILALLTPMFLVRPRSISSVSSGPVLLIVWLLALGSVIFLNLHMYRFFARRNGLVFAIKGASLHLAYYLYSGLAFLMCWAFYRSRLLALTIFPGTKLAGGGAGGPFTGSKD